MARCRFKVAPAGNSVGLYLASDGLRTLAIVVYPKLWQSGPALRRVAWREDSNHLAIAAGELDTIEIEGSAEQLSLLDRPVDRGGTATDPLFVPLHPGAAALEADIGQPMMDPVAALLGVEALMQRVGAGTTLPAGLGFVAPHLRDPLLRPVLYRYFVDEVEGVILHARLDYSWTEDVLPVLRGRPDPASLLVHAATGWPQIRCRFQDFTRATPILMAVCTALDHIASDGIVSHSRLGDLGDLRDEAIRLRRLLADVPTISRPLASRAAIDARKTTRVGPWQRALELAVGVLWPDAGLNLGQDDRAVEISVDSSRVWELVVLKVFLAGGLDAFDGNSVGGMPFTVSRPWVGLGTQPPRPDLLVGTGSTWSVFDAKYKDLTGTPAIADLYQMFAYSHLGAADERGQVTQWGLVYPAREEVGGLGPFPRSPDARTGLSVQRVRYPSIEECRRGWTSYLASQASIAKSWASPDVFEVVSA